MKAWGINAGQFPPNVFSTFFILHPKHSTIVFTEENSNILTMSHQTVYFVTGATRGIGLQLVTQLSADSSNIVYGTARDLESAADLKKLASSHSNFTPLQADVIDPESFKRAAEVVTKEHGYIDVLISNAGIADSYSPVKEVPLDDLERHWNVNTKGSIIVYQALRPLILKSQEKKIVFISTLAGSIGGYYPLANSAYGASKASLNFFARAIAAETKDEGIKVISIHPGLVSSDMGILGAKKFGISLDEFGIPILTPAESAEQVLEQVHKYAESDTFISYDGSTITW